MDELEQLKTKVTELTTQIQTLTTEKTTLEDANKKLNVDLTDAREHNREHGKNFKKFRDLNDKDKENMSQWELDLLKRQDDFEETSKKFQDDQAAWKKQQYDSKVDKLISEKSKGNKEVAEKLRFNFEKKLAGVQAETDEAISKKMDDAFGLVRHEAPDLVNSAINAGGRADDSAAPNGFAESQEGKSLAGALNLGYAKAKPAEGGDKK